LTQIPRAVLTDIEGTTTPIAFVYRVLFPYARAALPGLLRRTDEAQVAGAIEAIRVLASDADPLAQCLAWMDADAKVTPLKLLQGLAWRDGYESGALSVELYADVAPALRAWHAAGVRLAVYSSGSEAAQRLIFAHTPEGDLTGLMRPADATAACAGHPAAADFAGVASRFGSPHAGLAHVDLARA
jgi:enolase-phosphatase E1